jgi:hypothetical protein
VDRSIRHREPAGASTGVAVVLALSLLVSACSSVDNALSRPNASQTTGTTPTTQTGSFSDRMNAFFFGPPAQPGEPATTVAGRPQDVDCPSVDVRSGAGTLSLGAAGAEPNPTNVRYQVTISQMARECAVLGATMTIKVGIQGRIILGPAGGPGNVDIPLRLALVQEGVEPKTIWTKLYRVPVTVPEGQTNIPFVHVEEDMTVPVPNSQDLEAYVVYVGFDPAGLNLKPEKKKPVKKARASR